MASAVELQAKVTKFQTNMDRFNLLVNGAPGTVVVTDSGSYPSIPSIIAQFRTDSQALLDQMEAMIPEPEPEPEPEPVPEVDG